MTMFGTHIFYNEFKYNSLLTAAIKRDVIAIESVLENSTKISSYLPGEWPHGKYMVGYQGFAGKTVAQKRYVTKVAKGRNLFYRILVYKLLKIVAWKMSISLVDFS